VSGVGVFSKHVSDHRAGRCLDDVDDAFMQSILVLVQEVGDEIFPVCQHLRGDVRNAKLLDLFEVVENDLLIRNAKRM
jgi:hypothetical protein